MFEKSVTLLSWTESEIRFLIAFLNPLEISTVFVPDSVKISIKNESLLISIESYS